MHESINEPIEVAAVFAQGKIRPFAFLWNKRKYHIGRVNLVHLAHQGQNIIHYFSVSDPSATNHYQISFDTGSLHWTLTELFNEG